MILRFILLLVILAYNMLSNLGRLLYFIFFTICSILVISNLSPTFFSILVFLIYVGGIITLLIYVVCTETNSTNLGHRLRVAPLFLIIPPFIEFNSSIFSPNRGSRILIFQPSLIYFLAIIILLGLFFFQPLLSGSIRKFSISIKQK